MNLSLRQLDLFTDAANDLMKAVHGGDNGRRGPRKPKF